MDRIEELKKTAEQVDSNFIDAVTAMMELGNIYASTSHLPDAIEWWGRAAKYNETSAHMNLGLTYARCCKSTSNLVMKAECIKHAQKAFAPLFNPAFERPQAALHMGILYEHFGQALATDKSLGEPLKAHMAHAYANAAHCFQIAVNMPCTLQNPAPLLAANALGRLYAAGNGVAQNHETAYEFYKWAADAGDGEAQYNMAIACYHGRGTAVNVELAENLLKRALDNETYPLATETRAWAHEGIDRIKGVHSSDQAARPSNNPQNPWTGSGPII